MLRDPQTVWLGLEYLCSEGDGLWNMADRDLARLATSELSTLGLVPSTSILDTTVIRTVKAYPAYFGTYNEFNKIRAFTDGFENLFLVGRNGRHRYNNMDHSVLSGMAAAESISRGGVGRNDLWAVNAEPAYHEVKV